jgi:hypothetical protein
MEGAHRLLLLSVGTLGGRTGKPHQASLKPHQASLTGPTVSGACDTLRSRSGVSFETVPAATVLSGSSCSQIPRSLELLLENELESAK